MLLSFLSSLKALQYKYCRPVHYIGSFKHFKSFSSSSKLQNFLLQEGGDIVHLKIVDSFKADIKYAFAYGSSVFKQQPTDPSDLFETTAQSVLLDFIFVVDDTAQFHAVTTKQFPHHYNPFMIQCDHFFANNSGRFLSFITDSIGARIYYNAYAELPLLPLFKYGVISEKNFLNDLNYWETLYISGRLQKPVRLVLPSKSSVGGPSQRDLQVLFMAMLKNLKSCLVWSIVLQNSRIFSLYDLYCSIVRLSYLGDLRVIFAENPNKVENMIKGYYLMTEKVLKEKEKHKIGDDSLLGIWYEDTIHQLGNEISVKQFPSASQLEPIESAKQRILKVSDSFQAYVAKSEDIISPSFLGISRWSIIYISTWPSSIQSLKGILSAGPFKATKYLLRKIFKRFS